MECGCFPRLATSIYGLLPFKGNFSDVAAQVVPRLYGPEFGLVFEKNNIVQEI